MVLRRNIGVTNRGIRVFTLRFGKMAGALLVFLAEDFGGRPSRHDFTGQQVGVDDWRAERDVREAVDIYRMSIRWRVTVRVHGDSKAWQAYWVGEHDECLQRARILFQNPLSITLESAGIGGEMSDRWLPITTRSISL